MDKSLNKQSHRNPKIDADMKRYEVQEKQDDNIISMLDNQAVSKIFNTE